MVRIVLVDSQRLFRVSLKSLLSTFSNCQVSLDVSSLKEVPRDFKTEMIQLILFDPNSVKNKKVAPIQELFPNATVMILTDTIDRDFVRTYMELGISGFFSKQDCPSQIEDAIEEVSTNLPFREVRLGSEVRQALISDVAYPKKKKVVFTDREVQVLKLVCMEKTNAEISDILGLSIRTIESHRRRMIDKADCRSIIGVILNALELKSLNLKASFNNTHQAS